MVQLITSAAALKIVPTFLDEIPVQVMQPNSQLQLRP